MMKVTNISGYFIKCMMMSVLTLLVFCLPPESGEKIALGITVLLAFSVFMLAIAEKMPETSESVPLIGKSRSSYSLLNSVTTQCHSIILWLTFEILLTYFFLFEDSLRFCVSIERSKEISSLFRFMKNFWRYYWLKAYLFFFNSLRTFACNPSDVRKPEKHTIFELNH